MNTTAKQEIEATMAIMNDWDMFNGMSNGEIEQIKSRLKLIATSAVMEYNNKIADAMISLKSEINTK